MKKNTISLILFICSFLFFKNTNASGLFHTDSVYLFSRPYNVDTSSIYVVVKGYFGTNCNFQCEKVESYSDSSIVKAGYSVGPLTIVCNILDTFFVGNFTYGLIKVHTIVGANTIIVCDSFYKTNNYHLEYNLQPNSVNDMDDIKLLFFPTPSTNTLQITSEQTIQKAALYNLLGEQVMQQNIDAKNAELNIAALPKGIYLLKLIGSGWERVKRVVKE